MFGLDYGKGDGIAIPFFWLILEHGRMAILLKRH
jgi:hypothetical protein